ncbi:protein FAR1-RELATED SEQUENCE 5-like [Senna tora]|uniref:Protein FAR1-RELATED SEQUENCE 5-like n=1 Tax=Senna tora TaxID=362788 RepID=A0A834X928_9FABA|nr:protein FAR1-RELATED SEQUENCE 5-like [Senna tora]
MSRQLGGRENVGCTLKGVSNHLTSKRMKEMKEGEAYTLLHYFQLRQAENPSYFYDIQLDAEDQITNIFWADAEMVVDYVCFGNVVSFDTTYRTNKNCRPFEPFVGFNHHRQTVIFGAALLYDETAKSFEWLFKTFLKAMCGKKPKTIFTDEDAAMAKAISMILPDSYHRLCTCHLFQNALKNVNHAFKKSDSFASDLRCFIPEKYILKRCTKKARSGYVTDNKGRIIKEDPKLAVSNRFKDLSRNAVEIASKAAKFMMLQGFIVNCRLHFHTDVRFSCLQLPIGSRGVALKVTRFTAESKTAAATASAAILPS